MHTSQAEVLKSGFVQSSPVLFPILFCYFPLGFPDRSLLCQLYKCPSRLHQTRLYSSSILSLVLCLQPLLEKLAQTFLVQIALDVELSCVLILGVFILFFLVICPLLLLLLFFKRDLQRFFSFFFNDIILKYKCGWWVQEIT